MFYRSTLALAAAAAVCPRLAGAEPAERIAFEWLREPGAEVCADRDTLAAHVEARLARAVFVDAAQADTVIHGHVVRARTSPRWRAILSLTHHGETRDDREITSDAGSCHPLEDAVALFLGLLIEARTSEASPEPAAMPPTRPDPEAPSTAVAEITPPLAEAATPVTVAAQPAAGATTAPAPARVTTRATVTKRWSGGLAVGPVAALGVMPSASGGVRVAARLSSPFGVALEIDGTVLGEQARSKDGIRTTYAAQVVGLALCPTVVDVAPLRAGACARLEIGHLGYDDAENGTGDRLLLPLGAGTWLSVQVWRWFHVGAEAAGAVHLTRYPVQDRATNREIYRTPALAAAFEIHAAVQLP